MQNDTTLIIFGITGDLAQKKILPALYDLHLNGRIPKGMRIVGFSRRPFTEEDIRAYVKNILPVSQETVLRAFLETITYVQGNFDELESYKNLARHLEALDTSRGGCSNKLFYLSVPPALYENIARELSLSGLSIPCGGEEGFARILIEKPFGNNLETAKRLDMLLGDLFKEEQIFRIDHYLAKDSLLHIIEERKNDRDLEIKWNKEHIVDVEINLFETAQIEGRGAFYDAVGAFRDVGQNHMLQMLALVAMELPQALTPQNIQKARAKALSDLRPYSTSDFPFTLRAQYDGYTKEPGVAPDSMTETFFSVPVHVDSKRFEGVSFKLSSGKALDLNRTEIVVSFKDGTKKIFTVPAHDSLPAYQKILLDCISGDHTIFTSTEEVLAEWQFVTPIVEMWKAVSLVRYAVGSNPKDISK